MSFKSIPLIYAGDLPENVREELSNWRDELCFKGDGGCVFNVDRDDLLKLQAFKTWMILIGAWSEEETNLGDYGDFLKDVPEGGWSQWQTWLNGRVDQLSVAMTGT